MAKYSEKFKLMVVKEYLEGNLGYKLLARKHGVKSHKQIINWVKNYENFGAESLMSKKHEKSYSVQFKLDVLRFMKRTGSSVIDSALQFGITNPPMISRWKRNFLKVVLKPWVNRKDGHPCLIKVRVRVIKTNTWKKKK
ncbi:transposase [Heyndrickxia sporothermodurans]|uniref:Transposase n=1 Tax=Heyndrickxia sporothermodurans TaxID=46224 RepID=A0AB37HBG8_9BACI|nr:transposase [Heyndrickxia sporothermodurans]